MKKRMIRRKQRNTDYLTSHVEMLGFFIEAVTAYLENYWMITQKILNERKIDFDILPLRII